jgi:cystathionine gamma-lyase/cystathionine beta-lyase/cystathionine gamma-lyase/homocysteine desulfhydrase
MLHLESPTNPTMRLADIALLSELGHRVGAIVVVDNTFASPYLQRPLALGADIVMHSTTKFLGGHSDTVGGVAVAKAKEHVEWLGFVQNSSGAILSPMDSWLVLRGIKTLVVRMERHEENGRKVAEHLAKHPKVKQVHDPASRPIPSIALAKKQMKGFWLDDFFRPGIARERERFCRRFDCARSARVSAASRPISHRLDDPRLHPGGGANRLGVTPGLVRISVGIGGRRGHPRGPGSGPGVAQLQQ